LFTKTLSGTKYFEYFSSIVNLYCVNVDVAAVFAVFFRSVAFDSDSAAIFSFVILAQPLSDAANASGFAVTLGESVTVIFPNSGIVTDLSTLYNVVFR